MENIQRLTRDIFVGFDTFLTRNDNNDKSDTPKKKHTMSTHRFILEPYKGISTRHTCPNCHRQRCFSKYIDTEKQIQFPKYVGRCDHEQKCGYHFTPRDYFEQNPSEKDKLAENSFRNYAPIKEIQPIATSYIDLDIGEFYQFNLSSCIRQQNALTAQFVSFSLANLANIFYPPPIFTIINLCLL